VRLTVKSSSRDLKPALQLKSGAICQPFKTDLRHGLRRMCPQHWHFHATPGPTSKRVKQE